MRISEKYDIMKNKIALIIQTTNITQKKVYFFFKSKSVGFHRVEMRRISEYNNKKHKKTSQRIKYFWRSYFIIYFIVFVSIFSFGNFVLGLSIIIIKFSSTFIFFFLAFTNTFGQQVGITMHVFGLNGF